MEILNQALATPQRFQALFKLIRLLPQPTRDDVQSCLQPEALHTNWSASSTVINYAINFGFVLEDKSSAVLRLADDVPSDLENLESFRRYMQRRLTGITRRGEHNYLLNEFAAWYAVQDERVFEWNAEELSARFSNELYDRTDNSEGRSFNSTKFNGWRNWAALLGWGNACSAALGVPSEFLPDATWRLRPMIFHLLPEKEWWSVGEFMSVLPDYCPELDGGNLFELCWQASRSAEQRGTRISLMLSTGLRVLADRKEIEMTLQPDAGDVWQLAPAQGLINRVSHIRAMVPA